ncbi:amino acid transporter [Naviculisporaceae sp. PSN 640]
MNKMKTEGSLESTINAVEGDDSVPGSDSEYTVQNEGTELDKKDMWRMGKKQQLRRNFRFFSIFGFVMVLMATWEGQLSGSIFGLINGGTGGLIWMYIATFSGLMCAILSMSEMASMAPTTGGQYHWVSEFAPPSAQKFLSYLVGWVCVLGWQTGAVLISFVMASQVQGLAILNYPDTYQPERWHLTPITIAILTACMTFNTLFYRHLPLLETLALILHVGGFFAILIPLWVMGPRPASTREVFFTFTDGGGWGNAGLSCLVGILSPIFGFIGSDSATHMSEELRNASKSLPRAMIITMILNGILGFVMLVTFCMVLGGFGDGLDDILSTPTTQPFIQVFYEVVQNKAGATVMTCILMLMEVCGVINNIATSSRQLWAFARDKGVPFADWFAVVQRTNNLPMNALIFTYSFAVVVSFINIGSNIAFNVITSLGTAALLTSYIISISCITIKRIRGETLLPSHFKLGTMGLPLNIISVSFLLLSFIMAFFPPTPQPAPETMNWTAAVYGAVIIFSLVFYVVRGRHVYAGPVSYVRKSA